jgi:hypothetical protein
MKKNMTLPAEILEIFKFVKDSLPNTSATRRPALQNSLLLANHPASCRSKNNKAPNLSNTVTV